MAETPTSGETNSVPPLDSREVRKRRRERVAIALLAVLFTLLTIAEFRLTKVSSTLPFVNSIFFFGLLNFNIVILIALVWLVFRNIGKLFIERRRKILGARLKTKLVAAFLAFSIIPTLVLFVISSLYINSSFDKWFSIKIQNTLQASLEITHTYYKNADQTAMHFAEHLAKNLSRRITQAVPEDRDEDESGTIFTAGIPAWIESYLDGQRDLLALDSVEFYSDPLDERVMVQRLPSGERSTWPEIYPRLPLDVLEKAFGGERVSRIQHLGSGDLIRCLVPVTGQGNATLGIVVVNAYIPVSLVNKVGEIASVFDDYKEINPLKYPIKTAYFIILVMITMVIIFVAIWIGLYLARELTVPVERLVHAAQAVGGGNLDVSINAAGHDEISVLVSSFNKMTMDLRENRTEIAKAGADLEKRRRQLETILANVGAGVISVDGTGEITTFNRAVSQLLELEPQVVVGKRFDQVIQGEATPLKELIQKSLNNHTNEAQSSQWSFPGANGMKALAATATPLSDTLAAGWGVVVVIDDMTHLIKGQREMAWREVARRIAHEIKNPLTPIKLSAQRLQRRMGNYKGRDAAILQECTDTIIKHTDELKEMVNEFSNFARFPEVSPTPNDLNAALGEVVALYEQAHPQIRIGFEPEGKLPIFEFDRDQIKRVMINLLDNAVSALSELPPGKAKNVAIATHYNEALQMAVIEVKDTGPGMSQDVLNRVFEPYFSTKAEGTGLGLAIVKRIVNDHDGFIRVHSTPGEGTQFLIELPTAIRHGLERRPPRLAPERG